MSDISDDLDVGAASDAAAETASTSVTPLSDIFSSSREEPAAADVPARTTPEDGEDRSGRIPIKALRKERERRERMDREVERLEAEIARYHDQKAGVPTERTAEQSGGDHESGWQERATAYNKSCDAFVGRHGAERYAALEVAVNKLEPQQASHVLSLVEQAGGDPVERVYGYVKQLGLLDAPAREQRSIKDILSGKKEEVQRPDSASSGQLEQALARTEVLERRLNFSTSRAEFEKRFGSEKYEELDAAIDKWVAMGDPRVAEFAEIAKRHPDPVGLSAHVMSQFGLWSADGAQQHQQQPALPPAQRLVLPSNLAGARNVAPRGGPAWTGQTPLADIFNRSRA